MATIMQPPPRRTALCVVAVIFLTSIQGIYLFNGRRRQLQKPLLWNGTTSILGNPASPRGSIHVKNITESLLAGKYYYIADEFCRGIKHWRYSFLCNAAQAKALNRTYVFSYMMCLGKEHTGLKELIWRPLALYVDLDYLRSQQPIMFKEQLELHLGVGMTNRTLSSRFSVASFRIEEPSRKLEEARDAMFVTRHLVGWQYNYEVCKHNQDMYDMMNVALARPSPSLQLIIASIKSTMANDYDAVHVRRGDKLDKRRWPHVDADTRPEAILSKLPHFTPPGRNLYIATDEKTPHFFDPLKKLYNVTLLTDFSHLWTNGSEWDMACRAVLQSRTPTTFDSYMQAIVDYEVLDGARVKVETFNNLTRDDRHGIKLH